MPRATPGACCLNDATCRIVTSRGACEELNGVYQGDGTICDTPCSACCYWSGDPFLRLCVVTTEDDCISGRWSEISIPDGWGHLIGSEWSGLVAPEGGAICASEPSQAGTKYWCQDPRDGHEAPRGACCSSDGTCEVRTSEACVGTGLVWMGAGTACWPTTRCAIVPVERATWGKVKAMFR